jgi:hypothetical protein
LGGGGLRSNIDASIHCEIGRLAASVGAPDNGEEEEIKRRWLGTGVAPNSSEDNGRDAELRRGISSS